MRSARATTAPRPAQSPLGVRLFQAAKARGVPALQAAEAALRAEAAHSPHAGLKRRVRDALELGLDSRACRSRYGVHLDTIADLELTDAFATIDREWRIERDHRARVIAMGYGTPPRLSLMALSEMRLIARWLRRYERFRLSELLGRPTNPHPLACGCHTAGRPCAGHAIAAE